ALPIRSNGSISSGTVSACLSFSGSAIPGSVSSNFNELSNCMIDPIVLNHEPTKSRRDCRIPGASSCLRAFVVFFFLASGCQSAHVENLKTLGAVADGKTPCTGMLQKALDACKQAGGGEVIVPAGDYLIGSVVMASNTTLRLEKGATLIGSADPD